MSAGEADPLDRRAVGNGEESVCLTGLSTATRRESCGFASCCLRCFVLRPARRCCSFLLSPRPTRTRSTRDPGRDRDPTSSTSRSPMRRSSRTRATGTHRPSSCRARPPTAAASSSTRTGSTTTAARSATRRRTIRAPRATASRARAGTYLYPTDTAVVRQQRRRPRRAACRAAGDVDRFPAHAQHDQGLERRRRDDRDRRNTGDAARLALQRKRPLAGAVLPDGARYDHAR